MSIRQIDAEIADLSRKIAAIQEQVRARNAGNSAVAWATGYIVPAAMFIPGQTPEESRLLKQDTARRDKLFALKKGG